MENSHRNISAKVAAVTAVTALIAVVIAFQPDTRVLKEPSLAARDSQVMAFVLNDVLARSGQQDLLFDRSSPKRAESVEEVLYRHEPEPWSHLTDDQLKCAEDAAANLVERAKAGNFLAEFEAPNERIRIVGGEQKDADERFARNSFVRPVRAWPPGYAGSDNFAIVRVIVPWSMHHAKWTYLLTKVDGRWTVCLRQIVNYL